jgi:hypothetical protein
MSAMSRRAAPGTDRLRLTLRRRKTLRRALGVMHFVAWAGGSALLAAVAMAGLLTIR